MEGLIKNPALPEYNICDYTIILSPHEELQHRIAKVRKEFFENYKTPYALGGKSHVTLVRFRQYEMMEERIVHRLKMIAMGRPYIKVELRGFGSFPTHTIYINVISKVPIQNLVKDIKEVQRLLKLDKENKPHFIDETYIPIARKLMPWQYEQAWLEYENRNFTGRFIAENMLLIKRREDEKSNQVVERFPFQNLPVTTKQAELW